MSKVAIYARLSREDEDKIDGNKESRSIENQITILSDYAIKHDFEIIDVYYDEGYSGANTNRPELNKLLSDAKRKRFDTLLIKDLSRLGRTMHQVGELIETTFPSLNIRVISVNDHYDSLTYNDDESIVLRTFLNEYYLKDFKRKIHHSIEYRGHNKIMKYVPKYGYDFDENKNIIIDEYSANVVKRIFNEYASGKARKDIVNDLNKDNILTKSKYNHYLTNKNRYINVKDKWSRNMVWEILTDIEYCGTAVNLKRCKKHNRVLKEHAIPQIIDKDIFNKVQQLLASRRGNRTHKNHLVKLLYDADTNNHPRKTTKDKISYYYFKNQHMNLKQETLDKLIFEDVILTIKEILKDEDKQYTYYKDKLTSLNTSTKEELHKQLNKYNNEYSIILEQLFANKITQTSFDEKAAVLQAKINELEQNIKDYQLNISKIKLFDKKFKQFLNIVKNDVVDYEIIKLIVHKVHIYRLGGSNKNKQIKMKITYSFEEI